ncbi:MAG: hypothetical protein P4M08_04660 [Oligoflexia bacterium]|nr:hypothetical protein [Oligoflexia bacterium]
MRSVVGGSLDKRWPYKRKETYEYDQKASDIGIPDESTRTIHFVGS